MDVKVFNGNEVLFHWVFRGYRSDADLSVQQQFCDEVLIRSANEGWFRPSIVISVFVGWKVSVTSFEVGARVYSIVLNINHKAVEHLERGLNQVRKHYVEETQKTMTFKYSNKKWMDVEVDEATFDKRLVPLEDAKGQASDTGMKWEQWVGLVSRGKPESLVLVRLKPQITKWRAPGPGAIRKAEWKPIANRLPGVTSPRSLGFCTTQSSTRRRRGKSMANRFGSFQSM